MQASYLNIIHIALELSNCLFISLIIIFYLLDKRDVNGSRKYLLRMQTANFLLLIFDVTARAFRGDPDIANRIAVIISNFFVFLCGFYISILFTLYLQSRLDAEHQEKMKPFVTLVKFIYAIETGVLILNLFVPVCYYFDHYNLYRRAPGYPLLIIWSWMVFAINFVAILINRKHIPRFVFFSLLSYIVLPFLATILQYFFYGISLSNFAITIAMYGMFVASYRDNYIKLAEKEAALADIRIRITLSQMAPHFIFNSLGAIHHLCTKDPEAAAKAVKEFTGFLRSNLEGLEIQGCVTFERELEYVKNYLSLEKMRFQDRLKVEWDLEETEFDLPTLTLQPIVENAVKHGVCQRQEGGTVHISSHYHSKTDKPLAEDEILDKYMPLPPYLLHRHIGDSWIEIRVEDDGIGFDPSQTFAGGRELGNLKGEEEFFEELKMNKQEDRAHVGVRNVRMRLTTVCGGDLIVTSMPGKGTLSIIRIPFEK